ncbi:MAG TPA: hypothetical protein O0X39_07080 [Methanocorpusculum sp.]|nr:hypothetical protein [Methanocorpusculum sp.]
MIKTDRTFAENAAAAVIADFCKSLFVFCFALVIAGIRRFLSPKARQYERKRYEKQHQKETKETIPDEELSK